MENIKTYSKESIFYIDSSLGTNKNGEDIKGEEVARQLFNLGYKNLYLATGYEPDHFNDIDFIVEVIGKEAPW